MKHRELFHSRGQRLTSLDFDVSEPAWHNFRNLLESHHKRTFCLKISDSKAAGPKRAVFFKSVIGTNLSVTLTARLSGGTHESHRLCNRFYGETLFLNQLHDFLLLSWNSFLHPFLKFNFTKKIPWHQKISSSKVDLHKPYI